MADKVQQPNSEDQEIEKTKPEEKPVEDKKDKVENGDEKAAENGEAKEEDAKDESENDTDKSEEKTLKRKSTGGGDATDNAPSEGATPEKKAKTAESTEAEVKEDAKAVA